MCDVVANPFSARVTHRPGWSAAVRSLLGLGLLFSSWTASPEVLNLPPLKQLSLIGTIKHGGTDWRAYFKSVDGEYFHISRGDEFGDGAYTVLSVTEHEVQIQERIERKKGKPQEKIIVLRVK